MSTFKYTTRQNPQGGFTTRIALGEPVSEATLLSLTAGTAGTTPEIAEAVLRAFFTHVMTCCSGSGHSDNFLGLLNFQPSSGGSSDNPDGFHNADDINAGIALTLVREIIVDWQGTLTLQHMGEIGKKTPIIDSLINQATGALNIYIAGNLMQVRGNHLKFNRDNPAEGLFLINAAGVETRCTVYADIEPQSFTFLVPPGTTGAQTVRMVTRMDSTLRTTTYNAQITTA